MPTNRVLLKGRDVKNKTLLLMAAVLLSIAVPAQAEEGQLGATFDVTYMSRLMDWEKT